MGSLQGGGERHGHPHHIVILPFMAQGHMIPTVALAARLAFLPDTTVTVAATPRNIATIADYLPAGSRVRLHTLPFHGPDHGLPLGAENTDALPYTLIVNLFHASLSLKTHFSQLLTTIAGQSPSVKLTVIADVFLSWTVQVARQAGAACHAVLNTCGGYGTAAYFSLWQHLPHLHLTDDDYESTFGAPGFPETFRLRRDQLSQPLLKAKPGDPWVEFLDKQISLCLTSDAMLCNSVEELEPYGMQLLRDYTKLPVWAVGPVFLPGSDSAKRIQRRAGKTVGVTAEACVAWLNGHLAGSVLYVCFGSQNTVTSSQMLALATALEASGVAFVWVVRPPIGHDMRSEFQDEWLPRGFEARVKDSGKGLLVRKWAPQPEILAHPAVGAFLSHCGWNSILESLSHGVPIIGWPMQAEQYYNSMMLAEEHGVCVEIARGVVRGVPADQLEVVVREVMFGEKGREMRRRAVALADVIRAATVEEPAEGKMETGKGSSVRSLDEFIVFALSRPSTIRSGT